MKYAIKLNKQGTSFKQDYPLLSFDDKFWMLHEINRCDLKYILDDVLPNIDKVKSGILETYEFGYDATIIEIKKDKAIINYNYFEDEIEIESFIVNNFMHEWGIYLKKWQSNNEKLEF